MENTVDVPIPPNVIGTIVPPMDMPSVPQRPEGSIYYEQVFEKVVLNLATLAGTITFLPLLATVVYLFLILVHYSWAYNITSR